MNTQLLDIKLLFQSYRDSLSKEEIAIDQQNDISQQNWIQQQFKKEKIEQYLQQNIKSKIEQDQTSYHPKVQCINNIESDMATGEDDHKECSETVSLSFIQDYQQWQYFTNSLDWQYDLHQYGNLFRPFSDQKKYIKTSKFNHILNDVKNFQIDKGYDTKLYSGINIDLNDWIVLREQLVGNKSLLESAKQYVIHNTICTLYPKIFLELFLPVYIQIDQFERTTFISQIEYGEINLYNYSQQIIIQGLEYQLIFQQLYEQVMLMHKHNIAHRDIKPQNIIFVKNKGWVLCDFGDSIQYDNAIDFYNIRGTYAFLQPYLQKQTKLQGIILEQNLFENDIYALAITMIVIKYQIKFQIDIKDYLIRDNDPIIDTLLQRPPLQEDLEKLIVNQELRYIQPQIINQYQIQTVKEIEIEEFQTYISILQNTTRLFKLTDQITTKIINLIDQKLLLRDQHYQYLSKACYLCLHDYLNQLENLVQYKVLRQAKYWNNHVNDQNIAGLITFMDSIGLTDITYKYAKHYLKRNYDFTIHIIVIRNLVLFQQMDKAKQEFDQLFRFREFKQMTEMQLHLLVEVTLNLFSWDMFSIEDISYFQQLGIQASYCFWESFILEDHSNEHFLEISIKYINQQINLVKDRKLCLGFIFNYIEETFQYKNIDTSLALINKIAQNNLKYYCTTFHWLKFKQFIGNICMLLNNHPQAKKCIKKMNYISMFNCESESQHLVLKLLQINLLSKHKIKKQQKQFQLLQSLEKIVTNYHRLSFEYYSLIYIKELTDMLFILFYSAKIIQYFKIVTQIYKNSGLLSHLNKQEQQQFVKFIGQVYHETLNNKRYQYMLKNSNLNQNVESDNIYNLQCSNWRSLMGSQSYLQNERLFQRNLYLERM